MSGGADRPRGEHPCRPAAILIAGPTASGKSALALHLAEAFGGAIVNTDSMQVYADLRRLSARPGPQDEARAPHHLYGTVDGAVNFSAGHFVRAATQTLAEIEAQGLVSLFVGGTGLYFRALEEGLSEMPSVPEPVRDAVRSAAADRPTTALHADLAARDPEGARVLRPSDRLRVLRALEVHVATGCSILTFQGRRVPGPLAGRPLLKVFLASDRDELRRRIDARFSAMLEAGALDEVEVLRARRLDPMLPVMRAHGVPGLIAHLEGRVRLEEAVARGQADTRRYAKRQLTWFRHQMGGDWLWTAPETALDAIQERLSSG